MVFIKKERCLQNLENGRILWTMLLTLGETVRSSYRFSLILLEDASAGKHKLCGNVI